MREQQRRKENFQKLRREYAPFLHDARVPHAEGGRALRVFKEELLGGIFSGRLDQSHIQSEFFFKMLSTSFLLSISSSSDCELFFSPMLWVSVSEALLVSCGVCERGGLSQ